MATAVALALINVGLASLIVAAVGAPGLAPIWLSVLLVALALINIGLASLIVAAVGSPAVAPGWLAVMLLIVGIAAAVGSVSLWRQYLGDVRGTH